MILYHITHDRNLHNILLNGLVVNSRIGGFVNKKNIRYYIEKYDMQPIFLTNDIYCVKQYVPEKYLKNCSIIKINGDDISYEDEFEYLNDRWSLYYTTKEHMVENITKFKGRTFICRHNISTDNFNKIFKYPL